MTAIKLSAKFARQESEEARQARIGRRRIRDERVEAVQRMLGLSKPGRRARRGKKRGTLAITKNPRNAPRDPRQRLEDIVAHGLVPDLSAAEQALAILQVIGPEAQSSTTVAYGEFFGALQQLLGQHLRLCAGRLYERQRGRDLLRSIPAAIDVLQRGATSLKLEQKDLLIWALVRWGHAELDLRGLPDADLTRVTAEYFARCLPDLSSAQVDEVIAFARQFVGTVGSAYLGAAYESDDGTFRLSAEAERAAGCLARMLRALDGTADLTP